MTDHELSQQPSDDHRAAWRYLNEHRQSYPDGAYVPPMKAGKESRRAPVWAGLDVDGSGINAGDSASMTGATASIGGDLAICDDGLSDDFPHRLASSLLSHKRRGTAYVVANGGRAGLHLLFRRCYRDWVGAGYRIEPSVTGTYIKSISVRKAKHSWHFVDLGAFTGLTDVPAENVLTAFAGPAFAGATLAARVAVAAGVYTQLVQEHFRVAARLTAARTAVAAASRHLPEDAWLWRPSVLAVTLARVGGGFRGGYSYYPAYRGPGHKIDIRRAYTWALAQALPRSTALGRCDDGSGEQPGLYVCDVRGPGVVPVYLAPYSGTQEGFRRRLWAGDHCCCVLSQAEFAGLRSLGYRVEPGWGLVHTSTFSFAGFVQQIERLTDQYGPESAHGLVAKAIGVAVYGKLAENPTHEHVAFATERPSDDHLPFVDAAGEEVPDAWSHNRTAYRAHQHVDVASEVTALVRNRVYQAIARLDAVGIPTLAVDTDGLVCRSDPHGTMELDAGRIGGWRYCGYDPDAIIAGPRFAAWRGRAITAGTSEQSVDAVAIAHDRGSVTVDGKVMAPAWSTGPMHGTVRRTLRRVGAPRG